DRAEQRLFALRDESANAQLRHITASLQSNYEHLTDRMERPFEASGIPSGFRAVDYYTEGFTVGDLILPAAPPSGGKTSPRRASTHEKIEVIIVDYIQLIRTGEDDENRVQEIATITRNLKSLARELGVVVIGLSQLSRAAGDSGGEPKLSTLREGGSLEQDS